jgi:hypothetical protein
MVALQQDLTAAADAHHFVAELIETSALVSGAHERNNGDGESRKL